MFVGDKSRFRIILLAESRWRKLNGLVPRKSLDRNASRRSDIAYVAQSLRRLRFIAKTYRMG